MRSTRLVYWHAGQTSEMEADPYQYCPLCGKTLTLKILDHQTRKTCTSCGFIHYRNPAPTVSLLIVDGERVLLGKRPVSHNRELWATPSGYIEIDEDFLSTARREALEETGLEIEIDGILKITDSFFPPSQRFLNVYLLAHSTAGILQPGDDMGELRWFSLTQPLPGMAFPEDVDLINEFKEGNFQVLPVQDISK